MSSPGCRSVLRKTRLSWLLVTLQWRRLERRYDGSPMAFTDNRGNAILVTPNRSPPLAMPWRITWFDDDEPVGHCYAEDHREALEMARTYGAEVATAQPPRVGVELVRRAS